MGDVDCGELLRGSWMGDFSTTWGGCGGSVLVRWSVVRISFKAACISGDGVSIPIDVLRCGAGAGGGGVSWIMSEIQIK